MGGLTWPLGAQIFGMHPPHYSRAMPPSRRRAVQALRNSSGALSTAATGRMSTDLPWFDDLSAEDRSWVGLIVQAGIRGFVEWYDVEVEAQVHDPLDVVVFGAAPRELTGVISLQQTVELVRLSIRVVETNIDALLHPEDVGEVHEAVLLYAREVEYLRRVEWARVADDILERRTKHGLHLSDDQKRTLRRWLQRERPTVDA